MFAPGKQRTVFLLDGTWAQARSLLRCNPELRKLPAIRFTPPGLSSFRVRKQPAPECYSTIEAIHEILSLMDDPEKEASKNLLEVFGYMVERQEHYSPPGKRRRRAIA